MLHEYNLDNWHCDIEHSRLRGQVEIAKWREASVATHYVAFVVSAISGTDP